jgi:excinuclease ABC subunit A
MKFRTTKGSFRREQIVSQLDLRPLNQMHDLPIYGNEPRVRCRTLRGPWQEVELRVHSLDEIDKPAFWEFLEKAVRGFQNFADRAAGNRDEIMPWKRLGPHWHLSRRGFPLGKPALWEASLLEQLCQLLQNAAGPEARFQWNNQQLVHLNVADQRQPWATLFTKRPKSLDVHLNGPKSQFGLGRITKLGFEPELDAEPADIDVIKLKFRSSADLSEGDLSQFLRQHLDGIRGRRGRKPKTRVKAK